MTDIAQPSPPPQSASDIRTESWLVRVTPKFAHPYMYLMRLDRPYGAWLLLLPCWWSIALAADGAWPDVKMLVLFALGAFIMRGAGCVMNDIADRDFDGKVARTANRPIPSGQVSIKQAVAFLTLLGFLGLAILVQFNIFAIGIGVLSLATVIIYPYMKRFTYWPQVFLGLAFNWSALVGWAAVTGSVPASAWLLWLGGILWTLGYDTIYAHQDKEDDVRIGVKSTALKLGDATGKWLIGFFAGALVLIDLAGWLAGAGVLFHISIAGAALHATWQLSRLDINNPDNCLKMFRANRNFGLIIFAGAVLDNFSHSLILNLN